MMKECWADRENVRIRRESQTTLKAFFIHQCIYKRIIEERHEKIIIIVIYVNLV